MKIRKQIPFFLRPYFFKKIPYFILFFILFAANPVFGLGESAESSATQNRTFHAPRPALKSFIVEGKVAFSHKKEGGNASISWEQHGARYAIHLYGALGSGSIEIYGRPGFVGLVESNGKTHEAANAEQLIRNVMGWDIPVSPLQYWLQGLPVPGSKAAGIKLDRQGRLVYLHQQGWSIHYQNYEMNECGLFLPTRMTLENRGIRLRFIFKRWSVNR